MSHSEILAAVFHYHHLNLLFRVFLILQFYFLEFIQIDYRVLRFLFFFQNYLESLDGSLKYREFFVRGVIVSIYGPIAFWITTTKAAAFPSVARISLKRIHLLYSSLSGIKIVSPFSIEIDFLIGLSLIHI